MGCFLGVLLLIAGVVMVYKPPPAGSPNLASWFIVGGLVLIVGLPLLELLQGLSRIVASLVVIAAGAVVLAVINPDVAKAFLSVVPDVFYHGPKSSAIPSAS